MPGIGIGIRIGYRKHSGLSPADLSAILAIVNGITGEEDTTYLDAVNSLCTMLGGVTQGRVIDTLNEIGSVLCGEWPEDNLERDENGYILYYDDGTPIELKPET